MNNDKWKDFSKQVTAAIDFTSEYESLGVTGLKGVGDSRQGFCPIHNDQNKPSFSFFVTSGRFKCFAGCGEGSFADFVTLKTGKEFKEVIKEYGTKYNIPSPEEKKPPIPDTIPDKYVEALLNAREQLLWLKETRGLSMVSIKDLKIGWNGSRYTIPVYDRYDRLVNIRLYKNLQKDMAGEKIKSFHSGHHMYGEARLYGIDELIRTETETPVIICEGELDRIILRQNGFSAVTGTAGCNTWKKEWTRDFKDRHVYICYDNDDEGRKGALNVSIALHGTAKTIHVIKLPEEVGNKGDVTDYFVKLGKTAKDFQDLMVQAEEYTGPAAAPPDLDNDPLLVLGKTADGKILLYSRDTRITHTEDRRSLDRKALIDICGLPFVQRLEADPKTARANVQTFCDRIINQARCTLTGSKEKRGQGLYKHDDENIMIVDGQDSFLLDRSLTVTEIDTPLFEKSYIEYSDLKWFDRDHITRARDMTQPEALNMLKELASTIADRWTLKNEHDTEMLALAMIASILQGIFSWRPHFYITGKRASGKTTLLKFMALIWGAITLFREGKMSEAGLRQDLCSDNRIIIIDEFESNKHRQGITELLRTANHKDGGVVTKGTPSGKPLHFRIQSSAWLSSIEIGLNEAADRSRYIIFHFKGYKKGVPSISTIKELSAKTYALSLWLWSQGVDKVADEIRNLKDNRFTDRSHDNLAPLVSILALSMNRTDYKAIINTFLAQNSEALVKNAVEDEQQLLDTILGSSATVEIPVIGRNFSEKRQLTIAQILESDDDDQWAQVERLGVKVLRSEGKDKDGYFVCLAQEPLKQHLLAGTKYQPMGLKEILSRIPGANDKSKTKFAGVNRNMVRIPYRITQEDHSEEESDDQ